MSKLNLEYWNISIFTHYLNQLKDYEKAVPKMVGSIQAFGFQVPVLAKRNGEIIDGELRVQGAKAAGLSELPVIPADNMSDEQIKAFRIMVNKSSFWATWNNEALAQEIASLKELDFDLSLLGIDLKEIDKLLHSLELDSEKDIDAVPPLPLVPVNLSGDIWTLGKHKLICGDSTFLVTYTALLEGVKAHMVWTDPPYNVDYKGKAGKIKNDCMSEEAFTSFLEKVFGCMAANLEKGGAVYVAHADGGGSGKAFRTAFEKADFKLSSCLVWKKNAATLSRADYHWQHEPILYGWLNGAPHKWYGNKKQTTLFEVFQTVVSVDGEDGGKIWQVTDGDRVLKITGKDVLVEEITTTLFAVPKPNKSDLHPTIKPIALITPMLMNSSKREDVVLDPFGGSGSTLMACQQTERACRTIELDPKYADVIIIRWQDFTKEKAVHSSGYTFEEIKTQRLCEVDHE